MRFVDQFQKLKTDMKSIHSIKEFAAYIPSSALEWAAHWLLILLVSSPLYYLLRSIFLMDHAPFFINTNKRDLWEYCYSLNQMIGFIGILLFLLLFEKHIAKMNNTRGLMRKALLLHPVPFFLLLLLFWSFLSYLFSDNTALSLYGNSYTREGLFTYFAYAGYFSCGYLIKEKKYRIRITKVFAAAAGLVSLLSLLKVRFINAFLSMKSDTAIFFNSNHFGYYLCLAIMAVVVLVYEKEKFRFPVFLWLAIYAILVYALMHNNSFGPYVAVCLGLIFLFLVKLIYFRKKIVFALVLITVFIGISIGYNLKFNYLTTETKKLSNDISNIIENNDQARYAGSNRWLLWKSGIRYALEKPLFGYGPDNLQARYYKDSIGHSRPHNALIQYAASLGFPAALFYILAMLAFFVPLWKNRKRLENNTIPYYCLVFTYFMSSMVGVSIFYIAPFYFMFLGLSCNLFRPISTEPSDSITA